MFGKSAAIFQIFSILSQKYYREEPGTVRVDKWYRDFREFRQKREKGNTSKGITFFPKTFHRDEPFHLNSPRNYRKFHSNGKRSWIAKLKIWSKTLHQIKTELTEFTQREPRNQRINANPSHLMITREKVHA